jgi:hypothetical protein
LHPGENKTRVSALIGLPWRKVLRGVRKLSHFYLVKFKSITVVAKKLAAARLNMRAA